MPFYWFKSEWFWVAQMLTICSGQMIVTKAPPTHIEAGCQHSSTYGRDYAGPANTSDGMHCRKWSDIKADDVNGDPQFSYLGDHNL